MSEATSLFLTLHLIFSHPSFIYISLSSLAHPTPPSINPFLSLKTLSFLNTKIMCNSHQIQYTESKLRPRMLKELLADDSYSNSIYSNKKSIPKLLKSRSKAASTTISAIRKAFNAVKYLQFSSVKFPSNSPKSKPHKHQNDYIDEEILITVKVKDILRWRSFRDLVDEKPPPLDFSSSPHRCTTATTTTGTTSTGSNSSRSSWCDSDFTAEDYDLYSGDCADHKSSNLCIDFEEELENGALERAKLLMNAVQAITSGFETNSSVDQLLFDLFKDEFSVNGEEKRNCEIDCEVLRAAKDWVSGGNEGCLEWKMGGSKEVCMREMEWGNFEEERESVAMEMENGVLSYLMDEILIDLV